MNFIGLGIACIGMGLAAIGEGLSVSKAMEAIKEIQVVQKMLEQP